jgi:hypothetical protein
MKRILATVGVACCGLGLLGARAILPLAAQEQTSEQTLIDRLRQIQGQPERGERPAEPSRRAEELIREIEVIEQQLRSEPAREGPALSEEEVRRLVRQGLGVDVLKAETVERDGRQVYALTVMNPPGDYNDAFMIRTLLVDGTTGGLLGEVPHAPRTHATDMSPSVSAAGPDGSGLEIRRRTYR